MTPPPRVAERLRPFGTTIFAEMTRLAVEHGAVNLSQGFPDFEGPEFVREAAVEAIRTGHNQYARPYGEVPLVEAIARWAEIGRDVDAMSEVTVTSGCTEALAAIALGLFEPGDEVVLFEPYYDSYRAVVSMAGAESRFVPLRPPDDSHTSFWIDEGELRSAFGVRTKAMVVNTPHNPTGKVYTRDELELIASLAREHDALVISDEVYEKLVFDGRHLSIASLDGMAERTVVASSLGKTFSLTGWKLGWTIAPEHLTAGVRAAHQFLTFASATPLEHAAAAALSNAEPYVSELVADYRSKRDYLCGALERLGFRVFVPEGTYFIMGDHSAFGRGNDVEFCRWLTAEARVAAIPPSAFYERKELGAPLVRFSFCKKMETLEAAVARLERSLRG